MGNVYPATDGIGNPVRWANEKDMEGRVDALTHENEELKKEIERLKIQRTETRFAYERTVDAVHAMRAIVDSD